jgi:type II secretory pathway pseudopilin PulG
LLVVIAVIAILASLIFPITAAVNKNKIRSRTQSELAQLETAIESYKAKLGFYPPSDTNFLAPNVLFYELRGTTFNSANNSYETLDKACKSAPGHHATYGPTSAFHELTRGAVTRAHCQNFSKGSSWQFSRHQPDCTCWESRRRAGHFSKRPGARSILAIQRGARSTIRPLLTCGGRENRNDIYRISNGQAPSIKPPYTY